MHQIPRPAAPDIRRHTLDTTDAIPAARILSALRAPTAAELPPTYRPPVGDPSDRTIGIVVVAFVALLLLAAAISGYVFADDIVRLVRK